MRSLQHHFKKAKDSFSCLGDTILFSIAVRGRRFSDKVLQRNFNALVAKEDYEKSDKKDILRHMHTTTNTPRSVSKKRGKSISKLPQN